jgi:hypothetical protein
MSSEIQTEVEHKEPVDHGVEKRLEITEDFVFDGEQVERETIVQILEDGGVAITQTVQGLHDSLTLSDAVLKTIEVEK